MNIATALTLAILLVAGLTAGAASTPGAGQASCAETFPSRALWEELRGLRIELLHEKIERANARVAELERQLRTAESDRLRAGQLERSQAEQLAEFQNQLSQRGLTPESRSEIEKQRTQLVTTGAARLADRVAAASRRDGELRDQLGREQQSLQRFVESLRMLEGASARNP